ncbi:hypothetical protein FIBSPDRAFT_950550 [Athelia psychrophila]|uniref:Uncharacterized protein n=1 Tax=Athelia psychrophila TaxID=1759441 RepID=A0A166NMN4_9AGAM|nr:hypothetical protein FIBSPDRAFT_950550 [Fibularhizoctonia sp. CBS 109695]
MSTPAEEVPQTENALFGAPSPPAENNSSFGSKTGGLGGPLKSFSFSGSDVCATSAGGGDGGATTGVSEPLKSRFTREGERGGRREGPAREAEEAAGFGQTQEPSTTEESSADAKPAIESNPLSDPAWDDLAPKDKTKKQEANARMEREKREKELADFMNKQVPELNQALAWACAGQG